jgi:hypothetical protein
MNAELGTRNAEKTERRTADLYKEADEIVSMVVASIGFMIVDL